MATSEEARSALLGKIVQLTEEYISGPDVLALAQAWEIVKDKGSKVY